MGLILHMPVQQQIEIIKFIAMIMVVFYHCKLGQVLGFIFSKIEPKSKLDIWKIKN